MLMALITPRHTRTTRALDNTPQVLFWGCGCVKQTKEFTYRHRVTGRIPATLNDETRSLRLLCKYFGQNGHHKRTAIPRGSRNAVEILIGQVGETLVVGQRMQFHPVFEHEDEHLVSPKHFDNEFGSCGSCGSCRPITTSNIGDIQNDSVTYQCGRKRDPQYQKLHIFSHLFSKTLTKATHLGVMQLHIPSH